MLSTASRLRRTGRVGAGMHWRNGGVLLATVGAVTLLSGCGAEGESEPSAAPIVTSTSAKPATSSTTRPALPSSTTSTPAPASTIPPAPIAAAASTVPAQPVVTTVPMPPVVCMNLQDAQNLIQELGVFYSRSVDATGRGRNQVLDANWIVVGQSPSVGEPVGEGDAVLSVVKIGEPNPC